MKNKENNKEHVVATKDGRLYKKTSIFLSQPNIRAALKSLRDSNIVRKIDNENKSIAGA